MSEKWFIKRVGVDYKSLAKKLDVTPLTVLLMANRGITTEEEMHKFLYAGLEDLHDPSKMKDLPKAVRILQEKIKEKKKIRIAGDYDIDGIMSTYILYKGLLGVGADVSWVIPERIRDGYGLNIRIINDAIADGVDTLITCDNGIAASEQTKHAKENGMTVLITDHHQVPFEEKDGKKEYILPDADAVVDPHREDDPYPFTELCGAGVAYKLITLLYREMGRPAKEAETYLPYAAIATVGDIVDLTDENRIIVKEGLLRLPSIPNPGLRALMKKCGLEGKEITTYHIGFVIGPCLNAAGRLATAERSVRMLLAETEAEAKRDAEELFRLNQERQMKTEFWTEKAKNWVEESGNKDRVLVVYLDDCHESIVGIIAGRLKETYGKPAFAFTKTDKGTFKASGRSIEAYSMYEGLVKVKDMMEAFGGHPMAAGLTLKAGVSVDDFRKAINENCTLSEEDMQEKVLIDAVVPVSGLTRRNVTELSLLQPCGKGNRSALFADRGVAVSSMRTIGKNHNVVKCLVRDQTGAVDGIVFHNPEEFAATAGEGAVNITYLPQINEWRGRETMQMNIKGWMPCSET